MTRKEKFIYLLKRYGYLLAIALLALILIIAVAVSGSEESVPTNNANVNVNTNINSNITTNEKVKPTTISLPVANATVSKHYSNSVLQFNETLKQYEAHLAMDFVAQAGSKVCAVLDGNVIEVGNNYLQGNYVVVEHDHGLKSVYSSLAETISVEKGDVVKQGDMLGLVGCSAYSELEEGNHLHFEFYDNDKKIDPAGYLNIENK